jgi:hypothetical protein
LELVTLRDMKTYLIDGSNGDDGANGAGGEATAAAAAAAAASDESALAAADASARMGNVLARLSTEAQQSSSLGSLIGDGWSVEELLLCAGRASNQSMGNLGHDTI